MSAGVTVAADINPPKVPTPPETSRFMALVDTGAQTTGISKRVVKTLKLTAEGKEVIQTAGNPVEVNLYHVNISIPVEIRRPASEKDGQVIFEVDRVERHWFSQTVIEIVNSFQEFDVLLGMDIISQCNLFIGHGEFVLAI